MNHTYSVMPMYEDNFDKIIGDVVDQYRRNITTMPVFHVNLLPEGDPLIDKAEHYAKLSARYRDALVSEGVPSGILIQSTFGHGAASIPARFQKMVGFIDGVEYNVYCPEDKELVEYLSAGIKRLAMEHPKVIMLDDDVRLFIRPFRGCTCPLHMKRLNEINGTNITREDFYNHVMSHPNEDPITLSYVMLQREGLVNAVTKFREAIDSVDPTIQGINCTSGEECDSVIFTNPIFAGKNNPTIVRVSNGT